VLRLQVANARLGLRFPFESYSSGLFIWATVVVDCDARAPTTRPGSTAFRLSANKPCSIELGRVLGRGQTESEGRVKSGAVAGLLAAGRSYYICCALVKTLEAHSFENYGQARTNFPAFHEQIRSPGKYPNAQFLGPYRFGTNCIGGDH
jgi:hypothetical protein